MIKATSPQPSYPEDEEMDPVGEPYPNQEPLKPGTDRETDPPIVPHNDPEIPQDPESERVVQPEPLDN